MDPLTTETGEQPSRPGKRLALFFDGTWNIPANNTNVWRLSIMLAGQGADGVAWLQEKARTGGLGFRSRVTVTDEEDLQVQPCDSYAEFLGGFWRILMFGKRYVRWLMSDPVRKEEHWKGQSYIPAGCVETVNERIDLSVFRRCQLYADYRPPSLREWARRKKLDLEAIIAAPEKHAQLWSPVTNPGIESAIGKSGGSKCLPASKADQVR